MRKEIPLQSLIDNGGTIQLCEWTPSPGMNEFSVTIYLQGFDAGKEVEGFYSKTNRLASLGCGGVITNGAQTYYDEYAQSDLEITNVVEGVSTVLLHGLEGKENFVVGYLQIDEF